MAAVACHYLCSSFKIAPPAKLPIAHFDFVNLESVLPNCSGLVFNRKSPWRFGFGTHCITSSASNVNEMPTEAELDHAEPQPQCKPLRVALLCGGPSAERGISLNSARSVLDHLQSEDVNVSCYYMDRNLIPYRISLEQMYSNTPSDFDFKLSSTAKGFNSKTAFMKHLQAATDIAFPLIHGPFGEDGGIQELLEEAGIPFIGTGAAAAHRAFDKFTASVELSHCGFATIPSFLIKGPAANKFAVMSWFEENGLNISTGRVVVKPACSGSSIGVRVAYGVENAIEQAEALISEGFGDRIVIEVFIENGKEFTAIVIDMGSPTNPHPVTLLPTEVELCNKNLAIERSDAIFNYRRKYLPTNQVSYHTPPRFSSEAIQAIRSGAAEVFKQLKLSDFARIDGWLLPETAETEKKEQFVGKFKTGTVVFTDINLVSGMEQTSFLFQQSAQVGMSHAGVLRMILLHACGRYKALSSFWKLPYMPYSKSLVQERRQKVHVIFGGDTSERQVSLLSGTNVWLNLRRSYNLEVVPCLLSSYGLDRVSDTSTSLFSKEIWKLPYALLLRHTVEEVVEACMKAMEPNNMRISMNLRGQVISELKDASGCENLTDLALEVPQRMAVTEWIDELKQNDAVVFVAVHGGVGENGTLQEVLEAANIAYTGSGVAASKVCMDKSESSIALTHLTSKGVLTIPKDVWRTADILEEIGNWRTLWDSMLERLNASTICVKPASDGCSTGVARLCSAQDLHTYLAAIANGQSQLLLGSLCSLSKGRALIEMPVPAPEKLIFESFIETAEIKIISKTVENKCNDILEFIGKNKWVEITVGVVGREGEMHAFNPSITIKEQSDILSLEEKFQGGTGINLTPPPPTLISMDATNLCKRRVEIVANALQLEGFARIDAFVHVDTGEIMVIEVNTVPGMTPSTVLIHQALAEVPPIFPCVFFERIVEFAVSRHARRVT